MQAHLVLPVSVACLRHAGFGVVALYPALRYACTGLPECRAFGTSSLRCSLILYYLHLYEGRCGHEEVAVAWGHVLHCVGLWSNERLCLRHDGKNVAATKLHLAC